VTQPTRAGRNASHRCSLAAPRPGVYITRTRRPSFGAGIKVGRSVAQPGSALASGARGREFESPRSDQLNQIVTLGRSRSIHRAGSQGSARGYPRSSSLGPSIIGLRRQTAPRKSSVGAPRDHRLSLSRTGLSGEGLGRVKTRPLVGPLERSSSRSRMMQWAFAEQHPPATDCSCATGLGWVTKRHAGNLADTSESRRNPTQSLHCRRTSSGARPARPGPVGTLRGSAVR
jgi:hypothetical protein